MKATHTEVRSQTVLPAACVYGGGFVIGLTLVSFPASSTVLKAAHHFSDAEYGGIYLPQLVAAILGALAGGVAERGFGLKRMFVTSLVSFAAAQLLLAASAFVSAGPALVLIMLATGCFGFGFGFGGGPLNAFTVLLFPRRANAAVTALHMCAGGGLTVGPYVFALLAAHGQWLAGPIVLLVVTLTLTVFAFISQFPQPHDGSTATSTTSAHPGLTFFFWVCAGCSVLYSISEGMFSNWAILFLHDERGFDVQNAALALTLFWAALTLGRLLAALLSLRIPPLAFLIALPILMTSAFLLLPHVGSVFSGWGAFAFAGLSCSAFFPMLVGFTASRNPAAISWIASMLTAAMMVGVGLGSYALGALRSVMSISALYTFAIAAPLGALSLVLVAALVRGGAFGRRGAPIS